MRNLRRHGDVASKAVRRDLKPHPSQASSRGTDNLPIDLCDEALSWGGRNHTEDALLAKLEPQMLRVVLMMMMRTAEGVCSIEKGEGIAMD